jgi:hypothetical protein
MSEKQESNQGQQQDSCASIGWSTLSNEAEANLGKKKE